MLIAATEQFAQTAQPHATDDVLEDLLRRFLLVDMTNAAMLVVGPRPLRDSSVPSVSAGPVHSERRLLSQELLPYTRFPLSHRAVAPSTCGSGGTGRRTSLRGWR